MNEKNIIFTPIKNINEDFYPIPAYKNIPEWYRTEKSFTGNNKPQLMSGNTNQTIKKCIPVFDAITAGYILLTYTDIYVSFDQRGSHFSCPSNSDAVGVLSFHDNEQAINYPYNNMMSYPKFINPWSIKTSIGYSTLFIPPMHNPNGFFNILPGVVDTDTYHNPVNLTFVLNSPTFEGIIPAGTPICQVIPFKRDKFKMSIKEDNDSIAYVLKFFERYRVKFFNTYKSKFWHKKEYK